MFCQSLASAAGGAAQLPFCAFFFHGKRGRTNGHIQIAMSSVPNLQHHSLILQEGVEVVPDYDGSVKHYIFLRFLIQVDNHVAGSGAHCCGISLKRRRDGHPKFHKPEISH